MILVFLFFLNYSYILNSLLILESISLILFFLLFGCMFFMSSLKIILFYFVFIVSESALGLSILVKLIKIYGSNNFCSLNLSLF
uniref:NADH dehydrogenase subunit 4L n=1 Tax=Dendrothrips minowai TaxID=1030662 RepID=A0A343WRP2_9NEOP|nr:NADH dehydrogenase subunit 4L [Dendrothrips minowai]AWD37111.1 NADH dehydrogenase subunit 4L [Dendrothrips minowai]